MVNGHAALRVSVELEPIATPKSDAGAPIEIDVGVELANVAAWLCTGLTEFRNGGLSPKTKAAGGERMVPLALAMLAFTGPDGDFLDRARVAGRAVLRQNFELDRPCSSAETDAVIEFYIDGVFEVLTKVVETERAFRIAMAN